MFSRRAFQFGGLFSTLIAKGLADILDDRRLDQIHARHIPHDAHRLSVGHSDAVGPVFRQRLVNVDAREHSGIEIEPLPRKAVRISRSVQLFMVVRGPVRDILKTGNHLQRLPGVKRMGLNHGDLRGRQAAGFVQNAVGNHNLPKVVQIRGDPHLPVGLLVIAVMPAQNPRLFADSAGMRPRERRFLVDDTAEDLRDLPDIAIAELPLDLRDQQAERLADEDGTHTEPEFHVCAEFEKEIRQARVEFSGFPFDRIEDFFRAFPGNVLDRRKIRKRDDARVKRDFVSPSAEKSASVTVFVMIEDHIRHRMEKRKKPDVFLPLDAVLTDLLDFQQAARPEHPRGGDAVVVQQGVRDQVEQVPVVQIQPPPDPRGDVSDAAAVVGNVADEFLLDKIQRKRKRDQHFIDIKIQNKTPQILCRGSEKFRVSSASA